MKKLTLLILLISSIIQLNSQVNLDSSLVVFWPFYGAVEDIGPNDYDGIAVGCELVEGWDTEDSSAYSMDGVSDYIVMDDAIDGFDLPFTFVAHVKPDNFDETLVLFSTCSHPINYYGIYLTIASDGRVSFSYTDGGVIAAGSRRSKVSEESLEVNQWTCITITASGPDDMQIYFDGIDAGGNYTGSGGDMVFSDDPAMIGFAAYEEDYFAGDVDDIRIYDRLLTEDELVEVCDDKYTPTSIEEIDFDLSIYPNPAHHTLKIETERTFESYKIFNSIGQMVLSGDLIQSTVEQIDVRELNHGNYILVLEGSDLVSYRFVVD